ncbi:hypothetical protein DHB64_13915 [Antarcticibacterium sp. W02-3]|nr:hypothetical protein [Antarcticibacterium sp. W02-3]
MILVFSPYPAEGFPSPFKRWLQVHFRKKYDLILRSLIRLTPLMLLLFINHLIIEYFSALPLPRVAEKVV